MLYAGGIILSICAAWNLLLASVILFVVIVLDKPAPILYIVFESNDMSMLTPQAMAAAKALAILFNASVASSCILMLFVIWTSLVRGQAWAFWALLACFTIGQFFAFVADTAIGNKTVIVNIVLTGVCLKGLALAGLGLWNR